MPSDAADGTSTDCICDIRHQGVIRDGRDIQEDGRDNKEILHGKDFLLFSSEKIINALEIFVV